MNYLDIVFCIVILIGFLLGFKDGLVRKIIGIIGFILAVALAFEFSGFVGKFLTPIFSDEGYFSDIFAGVLIFVVIIILTSVIKRVVHPLDKVNLFINQLLGGFAGAIQIIFFISGFLLFLNIFNFPAAKDRENSFLYPKVYKVVPATIDLFMGSRSKAKDFIKNYIESKDVQSVPSVNDSTSTTK